MRLAGLRRHASGLAVILVCGLMAGSAWADPPSSSVSVGIDKKLQSCLDRAVNTVDTEGCFGAASADDDAAMNRVYRALMAGLDAQSAEHLRAAQRAWIAFRDADLQAWRGKWAEDHGTSMPVIFAQNKHAVTKNRILDLERMMDAAGR